MAVDDPGPERIGRRVVHGEHDNVHLDIEVLG
jgi:hypothetical protein